MSLSFRACLSMQPYYNWVGRDIQQSRSSFCSASARLHFFQRSDHGFNKNLLQLASLERKKQSTMDNSPFGELPSELRNRIYEVVFHPAEGINAYWDDCQTKMALRWMDPCQCQLPTKSSLSHKRASRFDQRPKTFRTKTTSSTSMAMPSATQTAGMRNITLAATNFAFSVPTSDGGRRCVDGTSGRQKTSTFGHVLSNSILAHGT